MSIQWLTEDIVAYTRILPRKTHTVQAWTGHHEMQSNQIKPRAMATKKASEKEVERTFMYFFGFS
eukprot:CAMPEP_0198114734 /NCGR_PEP_ID=MMETSP1442-20131203/6037_1 /TAXON_ID= /ORGANISM="Craspedostauros australis, Strain CCMP3328" /LENGTH=64 /DNA_ID=CAMNT_0043772113 /DNA_START=711 /DNA_END=902 /DNA_ORIENTATION=-